MQEVLHMLPLVSGQKKIYCWLYLKKKLSANLQRMVFEIINYAMNWKQNKFSLV